MGSEGSDGVEWVRKRKWREEMGCRELGLVRLYT